MLVFWKNLIFKKAMNIVVLGLPGAGKGTQSRMIASEKGFFYFEAGGFLRELAKNNNSLREIINSGKLVPDKQMSRMVFRYLDKHGKNCKGIIFDGYPRSISQYSDLLKWLNKRGEKIDLILFFELPVGEAVKRLSSRRVCPTCGRVYNLITDPPKEPNLCDFCKVELLQREDDTEDVIRERFNKQKESLLPLVELANKQDNFYRIDAFQPIEKVYKDTIAIIEEYEKKHSY